jgi:prephenate dehydrogenase
LPKGLANILGKLDNHLDQSIRRRRPLSTGKKVGIIGFGRFGQLWASILSSDFRVCVFDEDQKALEEHQGEPFSFGNLKETLASDYVFYCVPISAFEKAIESHLPFLEDLPKPPVLIDVLSVKLHPKSVFEKHLPKKFEAMLTHPMFGPDSVKANGLENQPIILDRFRAGDKHYQLWKKFFLGKGLKVVEMSADEHDRLAADSQGVTHFIGRIIGECGFEPTSIDTLGARKLFEIRDQVCNDTWQLFVDLQTYNPHTRTMRLRLSDAQTKIFNQLLPNRINKETLVVGIQGGRGSFNEEAARYYLSRTPDQSFELKYLHTTENVLKALHEGQVDRGQFAIHNSLGGIVTESVTAISRYHFNIVEEFAIKISHTLMIRSDVSFSDVDTVMTHPQVLRQCRINLEKKYANLKQTSGEGEMVDHAKVAEVMGKGELPGNIATMGSKVLAEINKLKIVEENLQDQEQNFTSFLWVDRPA